MGKEQRKLSNRMENEREVIVSWNRSYNDLINNSIIGIYRSFDTFLLKSNEEIYTHNTNNIVVCVCVLN